METNVQQAMQDGWDFMSEIISADIATGIALNDFNYEEGINNHIRQINEAIDALADSINEHAYRNLGIEQFKGYVAEEYAAGTYNIDAISNDSNNRAWTLHSTDYGSVDIDTNFGKSYSSKYMGTAEQSAVNQAILDRSSGLRKYAGQDGLVPADQLDAAREISRIRADKNLLSRPDVSKAYADSGEHLTDRIIDDEGNSSKPLTLKESRTIAKEGAKGEFDPEKHGYVKQDEIQFDYIKSGLKAGLTAAALTAIMQIVPELYKAVDYLIKNGEIDLSQIKKSGLKVITASGEGFLRGAAAYAVEILNKKGVFGVATQSLNSSIVGAVVMILMDTVRSSILVAAGKMEVREMGQRLIDDVVTVSGFLLAAKVGGIIAQALGWELPGAAYLIGSVLGCAVAAVYNIGKKKLISLCADTGFTCFGLVEQNYELPEEVLKEMGIETIPIPRIEVDRINIPKNEVEEVEIDIDRVDYETISFTTLRRGVIGVNKIGYVW